MFPLETANGRVATGEVGFRASGGVDVDGVDDHYDDDGGGGERVVGIVEDDDIDDVEKRRFKPQILVDTSRLAKD